MAVAVFGVNVGVVINEVLIAGIVRRIDIDYIDFTSVGISEGGKSFEIVALNKNMIGSIGTSIGQCSLFVLD